MVVFICSGAYWYSVGRMIACLLFVYAQVDPLVLNPVDVFKALESLAPDVTEESIDSVSEEINTMKSITLEELLLILKRCGITPVQCMNMRRVLERNAPLTVRVPVCGSVCFCCHMQKTRAMVFSPMYRVHPSPLARALAPQGLLCHPRVPVSSLC